KTEVRVLYDRKNLYLGITCFDSQPEKIIATEMRRDSQLEKNDAITLIFDTFHDHRNCFFFSFNPLGARTDGIVTDEGRDINQDWDGVWYCATSIDHQGWYGEVAIPFRTFRFRKAEEQTWGFNVIRLIRRKNEVVSWTPLLRDYGFMPQFKISRIGHLTGLKGLQQRNTIQVNPYILGRMERDYYETQAKGTSDVGLDIKYSLSSNLIADLTVNTDFAQVEADEVQVNLTRFNLFFPEKRDFFLEGAGMFRFGERMPAMGPGSP
ncbi:MAG: carbohydrate binding family 9 domain-containing protein, partial [candidate division KSB1 bacterium]|nr:carbohydrate binding family 9 domain-containing protein [candidate division KSB1 bacterium]